MVKRKHTKKHTKRRGGNPFTGFTDMANDMENRMKSHRAAGGSNVLNQFGIDIQNMAREFVANNDYVKKMAPKIKAAVPPSLFPSELVRQFDVKKYIKEDALAGHAQPVALDIQAGIVEGLKKPHGIGRRRRVGRPSLQSKRARARHVSAKKRHAKFAHKKVNKKRLSKK